MARHDEAWREKVSEALKGKRPKNLDALHAARRGKPNPGQAGEKSGSWKGDDVGYMALHTWIRRNFERPAACEQCGDATASRYEWDNIVGDYKREREGWQFLCVSCHRKKTFTQPDFVHWNKGQHIQTNTGRTHFKKGEHAAPSTEFKPGQPSWRKYLEPKPCKRCGEQFQPKEDSRLYCCRQCYWGHPKQ